MADEMAPAPQSAEPKPLVDQISSWASSEADALTNAAVDVLNSASVQKDAQRFAQQAAPVVQAAAPALAPAAETLGKAQGAGFIEGLPWYGKLGLGLALVGTVAFGIDALRKR